MAEAKHAWATLKLARRLTLLNNGANTVHAGGSTTIWYDVPAPVIIHCCQELPADAFESEEVDSSIEKRATAVTDTNEPSTTTTTTTTTMTTDIRDNSKLGNESGNENRHRNTVELTAVTSVKTDDEGVPRISFSFLQADDESRKTSVASVTTELARDASAAVTSSENDQDASTRDQLYDFPRNSYVVLDEIESEKVVESSGNERQAAAAAVAETRVEISSSERFHAVPIETRNDPKHEEDASPEGTITPVERASDRTTASPEEKTDLCPVDDAPLPKGRYPKVLPKGNASRLHQAINLEPKLSRVSRIAISIETRGKLGEKIYRQGVTLVRDRKRNCRDTGWRRRGRKCEAG